jgi:short-subunit dehydrogenase
MIYPSIGLAKEEALLFVNKKKQKTLSLRALAPSLPTPAGNRSFLVLFFKKEPLACHFHKGKQYSVYKYVHGEMPMSFDLAGATIVLTGAASGMGAELAVQLAAKGANLALVDRNEAGLQATVARAQPRGTKLTTHVLDVSDPEAVAAFPAEVATAHGRVSVLINNAGVALVGTFEQASLADFEWLMNINFWGGVRLTHAFLPMLQRETAAQIVLLSSVFGIIGPPGQTAYAASKFAIRGFGESLRHELAGTGIGVTLVHPGGIDTNIARAARVGENMNHQAAQAGVALFQKMLKTKADVAAAKMIAGIEKRQKRVLIGTDAYQIDTIQRLMPVRYWDIIGKSAGGLDSITKAKA